MKRSFCCTEFTLKIIAMVFMVVDHIHSYLRIGPEWISLLPRFVAPLFVYFLVEGFYHTRNWKKYFQRIFTFACIMLAGNMVINYMFHSVNYATGKMDFYALQQGNNIFLTLSVYLLILKLLQTATVNKGAKKYSSILGILILSLISLPFCEGSFYLLPLLFVFYFGYNRKKIAYAGVIAWSVLLLIKACLSYYSGGTGISLFSTLCFDSEWAMIAVILPIYLYSGQRGVNSNVSKWLFYVVYPAHLWVLMILAKVLH